MVEEKDMEEMKTKINLIMRLSVYIDSYIGTNI